MKLRHCPRRFTPRWWITRYWHNRALLDDYWNAHPEMVEMRHINRAARAAPASTDR
jgi:hypothetical protein